MTFMEDKTQLTSTVLLFEPVFLLGLTLHSGHV